MKIKEEIEALNNELLWGDKNYSLEYIYKHYASLSIDMMFEMNTLLKEILNKLDKPTNSQ